MECLILGPVAVLDEGRPVRFLPASRSSSCACCCSTAIGLSALRNSSTSLGRGPSRHGHEGAPGVRVPARKALGADRLITRAPGYWLRVEDESSTSTGSSSSCGRPRAARCRRRESGVARARERAGSLAWTRAGARRAAAGGSRGPNRGRYCARAARGARRRVETLVAQQPLRERLHGQLMLALYGSGRQADALEEYRHTRETLVDELGSSRARRCRNSSARSCVTILSSRLAARVPRRLPTRRASVRDCAGRSWPSGRSRCLLLPWSRSWSSAAAVRRRTAPPRPTCGPSSCASRTFSSSRARVGGRSPPRSSASSTADSGRAWPSNG